MSKIKQFEDLPVWQKARLITRKVYEVTENTKTFKNFSLKDQCRRSSGSIMANIAEGFDRDGNKEFIQFLSLAKASAAELRSHLYIAVDQGYLAEDVFESLKGQAEEIARMLSGFIAYLRNSELKGRKYKDSIRESISESVFQ